MTPIPSITGATRVIALIADPVETARSPAAINLALERRGRFGAYVFVPLQVQVDGLREVITAMRQARNFVGAVVSMPHKSSVVALLDELSAEAQLSRAVNVVRRTSDGGLIGAMLDGEGFVAGLRRAGHHLAGASCLLVGAGGAGSAIAFAVARHGCATLTICNRTSARSVALADRVREAFPHVPVRVDDGSIASVDLVINATSLGMRSGDPSPVAEALIAQCGLVADIVTTEGTELQHLAERNGVPVYHGLQMLEAQIDAMLDFIGVE